MVKLLFCGDVNGKWKILLDRLDELQKSKHGPFDCLFLVGNNFSNENDVEEFNSSMEFPIQTYGFSDSHIPMDEQTTPKNFQFLNDKNFGICHLPNNLTVCYNLSENSSEEEMTEVKTTCSTPRYRGCDILITKDWPQEMHHFLEDNELNELKKTSIGIGSGSRTISSLSTLVRPRYHFVSGLNAYFQRSPFCNPPVGVSQVVSPFTRLISVDQVSLSKEKGKKWLHALAITPIINLRPEEFLERPAGATDCPYVQVGQNKRKAVNTMESLTLAKKMKLQETSVPNAGGGAFFFGQMGVSRPDSSFSATPGAPPSGVDLTLVPPSASATRLFVGGLLRETHDGELLQMLSGAVAVRRPPGKSFAFVDFDTHESAKKIIEASARRGLMLGGRSLNIGWGKQKDQIEGKLNEGGSYIIPLSTQKTVLLQGIPFSVSTRRTKKGEDPRDGGSSQETEEEIRFRSFVFDTFPGVITLRGAEEGKGVFLEFEREEDAMAVVSRSLDTDGGNDDNKNNDFVFEGSVLRCCWAPGESVCRQLLTEPPSEKSKVLFVGGLTSDISVHQLRRGFAPHEDQVFSIKRPEGRVFAFVEFKTPDSARQAMSQLKTEKQEKEVENGVEAGTHKVLKIGQQLLQVGWAKGKAAADESQSDECWFCFASPKVKVHLVCSVGSHVYLALPRGGLVPSHVLLCPINCIPSRIHFTNEAKLELLQFQNSLDRFFNLASTEGLIEGKKGKLSEINVVSLRFERAIRTRSGRDHMQLHVVPIPVVLLTSSGADSSGRGSGGDSSGGSRAIVVFMQKASQASLKFHEIQDDRSVDEVVMSMEGGPYQEYFYIELPQIQMSGGVMYRRFVYVKEENSEFDFPMQFGLELASELLQKGPNFHWKHALLPEDQEIQLAERFRTNYAPYDHTLLTN